MSNPGVSTWRCHNCDAHGEGVPADMDRAANRHTEKAGHSTVTSIKGVKR